MCNAHELMAASESETGNQDQDTYPESVLKLLSSLVT